MLQGGIMIADISYISAHDFNMKTHKVSVTEDNRVVITTTLEVSTSSFCIAFAIM